MTEPRKTPRQERDELAFSLARSLLSVGDDKRGKCSRIQFKIGAPSWPDELDAGGLNETGLALHFAAEIKRLGLMSDTQALARHRAKQEVQS